MARLPAAVRLEQLLARQAPHARTRTSSAQADPEPSMGDYLPAGMKVHLGRLHTRLKLASFKPLHEGKATEKVRKVEDVISNKFLNGRSYPCKRIVLSEEFRAFFSEKTAALLTFVPAADEALIDNERNALFRHCISVRNGDTPKDGIPR